MDASKAPFRHGRALSVVLSFVLGSFALAPAYASDTEVYARSVDFSGEVTPVLMMVLDSSGSMLDCLENCGKTDTNPLTRIGALRKAMEKVLFGVPEPVSGNVVKPAPDFVKMGYARFNPDANDGGWMRYPAMLLSATVKDKWTENSSVDTRILASGDDVSGTSVTGATYKVGAGMSTLGLRFDKLQIPLNAKITGAMLHFTRADANGDVPRQLKVAVEQADSSAVLGSSWESGRTFSADSSRSTDGAAITFYVDVTDFVQDTVSRPGWCGGNALTLRVKSDGGSRVTNVDSFDGSQTTAPQLVVSYTTTDSRSGSCITMPIHAVVGVSDSLDDVQWPEGGSGSSVRHHEELLYPAAVPDDVVNQVALRFNKVSVPSSVDIEKAWLYVTSASTDNAAASVEVAAFATDSIGPFCTRNETTRQVSCVPPPTGALTTATTLAIPASGGTATDGLHRAVEVTQQVREVLGRSGWLKDNSIGFLLRNAGTTHAGSTIYATDATLSKAAFLHIVWSKKFTELDEIDKPARQDLFDDINARMYASGGTPLGDAYAEAARYMLGMAPYSKDSFLTSFDEQAPEQTYYQPDPRTVSGSTYVSPLENTSECSANFIYLMSDGEPNNVSNVTNNSNGITSGFNLACGDYTQYPVSTGNANANFACMMSVAHHLASGVNQKKAVVRTNTVLFDNVLTGGVVDDMAMVADDGYGKGQFFHAKTSSQLTDSLLKTMSTMLDQTGSITAPGVAVNQFNRLTHLDQLYYAVFDPNANHARWLGNIKRYRLKFEEKPITGGGETATATIVDQNDDPAIDPDSTFFSTKAQSFWSEKVDGNNAVLGGAASRLPAPSARKIYTWLANYGNEMQLVDLSAVTAANGATFMGLSDANQFTNLRNWLKGYNIDIIKPKTATEPASIKTTAEKVGNNTLQRFELGGVLHSQPVLVNYGYLSKTAEEAAKDPSQQDNMVFFSSMEGMLHAVDANSGVETFAFLPKEKLQKIDELVLNGEQSLPEFGLDATWTVWRVDGDKDQQITTGGDDRMWLFGGMRMGGRNYYALDVTDRSKPVLKWVLRGGVADTPFEDMGQTWSKPVLGDVMVDGKVKTVLFVAGGYDEIHEKTGLINAADAQGNQLYIVDPDDGSVLWWASNTAAATLEVPDMKFSITAEPKLFDANKDGLVDAVYFGDLGGQLFRLDIDNKAATDADIGARVQLLASVGQTVVADVGNQRRFYEAPSVATLLDPASNQPYVVVALGTGYRSHPLDLQTEDFFYLFKDPDVLRKDLLDIDPNDLEAPMVPADLATVDLTSAAGADVTTARGWKINLPEQGEKVLASPMILLGEVFFVTYIPSQDSSASKCSPVIGSSRLWRVGVADGGAARDVNADGDITAEDRFVDRVVDGLGGPPQLLVGDDGRNAVLTGTGALRNQDLSSPGMRRTRWYSK